MGFLNVATIRSSDHLERREIDATEWAPVGADGKREPAKILVRQLTGKEKDRYENWLVEVKRNKRTANLINARAKLAVLSCINEDGTQMFQQHDVDWLTDKPAIVFDRILRAYEELNGALEDEEAEDLEKNFE